MRYRKKPVVIDAIGWSGDPNDLWQIKDMAGGRKLHLGASDPNDRYDLMIVTLEGTMTADPGDWIIRGVAGELYPCKPDIFEQTYEEVKP